MSTETSISEVTARHRKEIKAADGANRAELKKAKTTAGKGKKAKEVMQAYVKLILYCDIDRWI
jgi:hypothetical protein